MCSALDPNEAFTAGTDVGCFEGVGGSISGGVFVNHDGWGIWGALMAGVGIAAEVSGLADELGATPEGSAISHGYHSKFENSLGFSGSLSGEVLGVSGSYSPRTGLEGGSVGMRCGVGGASIGGETLWIWPQGAW